MKKYRKTRLFIDNRVLHKLLLITVVIVSPLLLAAQEASINISLTGANVEDVIAEIRNQSDINIVYNHEELKKQPKISVNLINAAIDEALRISLQGTSLEYKKVKNTYVIQPKEVQKVGPSEIPKSKAQVLRGRVIDRDTKLSLPFANIIVMNTTPQKGVTTDEKGYFRIEDLLVGRYTIQVSYIGYESAVLSEILVGVAKEVVLSVELSESVQDMQEVVVSVKKGQPLNEMATISGKSFSVEETKRYAASISDPARMAQSFAGVATSDDASNEIVIRGNSPNWMQWRLEGVEIPSPNHFAEEGYTSGAVSILSTNMLGKSDFYTAAFPAEYGSALSGVFDLRLRNGNSENREYSMQIGLLGAEFAAEGPFKKGYRGSYLINYRYATFSILNNLNIEVSENALPSYQDLSFKVNLPTKRAGTFSFWGIGGASASDEQFFPDTTQEQKLEDGYSDFTTTGMYATGIGHTFYVDDKSYMKSIFSHSKSYSSQTYDVMNTGGVLKSNFYDDLSTSALRFNTYYNRKLTRKLTLRLGVNFSNLNYSYLSKHTDSLDIWNIDINGNGNTNLYQAYLQTKYKPSDKLVFTAGLHYTYFALNADNSIEPRLGMQIELENHQKIGLGFGMHSKNENLPVYFVDFENPDGSISQLNKSLTLTRSTHYVISYEKLFTQNWAFKTEVYYQSIINLPVPNNSDKPLSPVFNGVNPNDTLISDGAGKNYGIEFTLQRYFNKGFYVLATSSIFESKYKPIDGKWYNTKYNLNYINNLVGGKEINWGTNKMLSVNGKVLWTGGRRYIPVNLEASRNEGKGVYEFSKAYSQQLSDYFRIDLGVRIHFFKQNAEHIITLDIQNLTNRLNAWHKVYDSSNEQLIDYPMAGLIPVLSYRIEF